MYLGKNYPDRVYGRGKTIDEARAIAKAESDRRDEPMYIYKHDNIFIVLDDTGNSHQRVLGNSSLCVEEVV